MTKGSGWYADAQATTWGQASGPMHHWHLQPRSPG